MLAQAHHKQAQQAPPAIAQEHLVQGLIAVVLQQAHKDPASMSAEALQLIQVAAAALPQHSLQPTPSTSSLGQQADAQAQATIAHDRKLLVQQLTLQQAGPIVAAPMQTPTTQEPALVADLYQQFQHYHNSNKAQRCSNCPAR